MAQIFVNGVEGTLSTGLGTGVTTMQGAFLADLPPVSNPGYVVLVIDPRDAEGNEPEVVHVTAHTASATSATVLRAQEGTADEDWPSGAKVVAPITKAAVDAIVADIATNTGDIAQEVSDRAGADSAHAASVNHPLATQSTNGLMSAADKTAVDGIEGGGEWAGVAEVVATTQVTTDTSVNATTDTITIPAGWNTYYVEVTLSGDLYCTASASAVTMEAALRYNSVTAGTPGVYSWAAETASQNIPINLTRAWVGQTVTGARTVVFAIEKIAGTGSVGIAAGGQLITRATRLT